MNGGSSLPKTCTVEGCDGKFYAKGRCRNHWHQEWRRQDRERGLRAACAIEGCDKPYVSRGWCEQHYNAWKRHRDPLYRKQRKVCTVPDCDRKHSARGWCELHYARWKAHGDPLQVYPPGTARVAGVKVTAYNPQRRQRAARPRKRTRTDVGLAGVRVVAYNPKARIKSTPRTATVRVIVPKRPKYYDTQELLAELERETERSLRLDPPR
jgi:hypothetical protein